MAKIHDYARTEGEPLVMNELIDIFYQATPQRLEKLNIAARAGDSEAMRFIAHTMKTSCAYLGARRMQALCIQL